ncbi:hypothetical protein AAFF_G00351480 [Aldrovandia affinis]|uniref:Uncharacterized protein n=1 Tax=Aldrovandia affinis TaxID=143900 RepID=A0AAD7WNB1_9TELE|nr:hypothetical protein AAFF_G00351480 [Aldrovandia affinis]
MVKCTEWTRSPCPAELTAGCSRDGSSESPLAQHLNLKRNTNVKSVNNVKQDLSPPRRSEPEVDRLSAKDCTMPLVMEVIQRNTENAIHDKSSQLPSQSQYPNSHSGFTCQDVKLNRESFRTSNTSRSFHASQQRFQHPPSGIEKQCLLQIQGHGQILHPQPFTSKLSPVLSRPPAPIPSTLLYPIHLPPSMSSTSITIHHTILQHHTAFLQPQPPLFSQVFPLTRMPLGAEMCPPGPPSFMAPASLHPMSMTFHPLPHPGTFPTIIPPHPSIIPL